MKKIFITAFSCLLISPGFGQLDFRNSNVGRMMNLDDRDGKSLSIKYDPNIDGSPYLNDQWIKATLTLFDGRILGPWQVKLNIENNELHFTDSTGTELVALDGKIKKIDCPDFYTKDNIRYVFKCGYPAIDSQSVFFYYQVLTDGKIEFLVKKSKYIRSNKDVLSGEMTREFIDHAARYYVFSQDRMIPYQPSHSFVMSLMKDKEAEVAKFIASNKINLKKTADAIKVFAYYNSL